MECGNVQSTAGNPLIVGDSLYFYVSGRYNSKPVHDSNFATALRHYVVTALYPCKPEPKKGIYYWRGYRQRQLFVCECGCASKERETARWGFGCKGYSDTRIYKERLQHPETNGQYEANDCLEKQDGFVWTIREKHKSEVLFDGWWFVFILDFIVENRWKWRLYCRRRTGLESGRSGHKIKAYINL